MITAILVFISGFIIEVIKAGGYAGIFFLMLIQSVNIPLPSEIIMPFSGFLAYQGIFSIWAVIITGAFGSLSGSLISYKIAAFLVKDGLRERYGVINFFLSDRNLAFAERWFKKYGSFGIFLGRIMPVVSTFISFPAGLAKMPFGKFAVLTFLGSVIWSSFLAGLGFSLAQNWMALEQYFKKFDYFVLIAIIIGVIGWVWHRFRNGYADH